MEIKRLPGSKPLPSNGRVEGQQTIPFPLAITPLLSVSAQRISASEREDCYFQRNPSAKVTSKTSLQDDPLRKSSQTSYNTFDSGSGHAVHSTVWTNGDNNPSKPARGTREEDVPMTMMETLSVCSDPDTVFEYSGDESGSECSSGYDTRASSPYPTPLPTLQMHGRFTRELKQYAKAEAARIRAEKERQREVEDEFRRYQENTICHRIKGN